MTFGLLGGGCSHYAMLSAVLVLTAMDATAEPDVRSGAAEAPDSVEALDAAAVAESVDSDAIVVTVQGRSRAQRTMRSGQAVTVVELKQARGQAADLGTVVARVPGVSVRREGGLGSATRLSLNGLGGDRVLFFLDGIPLDRTGHSLGLANVPVGLLERIEIYRGVTPVRFGGDAIGGAVNLVTDLKTVGTLARGSLQLGSFGQRRAAASLRHRAPKSHVLTSGSVFLDSADNDYPVLVDDVDSRGRVAPVRVRRFHDGYDAQGLHLQTGLVQLPWASRLLLTGFYTRHNREIQHNQLMTVPYGEVQYAKRSWGAHLDYAVRVANGLYLDAVVGRSFQRTLFEDLGECRYTWRGACVATLPQAGEVQPQGKDQRIDDSTWYSRINWTWMAAPDHQLRVSLAPEILFRQGRDVEIEEGQFDGLQAERELVSLTSGVEYEASLSDDGLRNILFAKLYSQRADTQQQLPSGIVQAWNQSTLQWGVGDSWRWELDEESYLHASYEWATRLPEPEQLFGNGLLTVENLQLQPESSHNFNLGLRVDQWPLLSGTWEAGLTGFGRVIDNMQVLVGGISYQQYDNVGAARAYGVEASTGWTAPGRWLSLRSNATWQRVRNASSSGEYQQFVGEPLPNQPQGSANASLQLAASGLLQAEDRLIFDATGRYVQKFFRGWQSAGRRDTKLTIPDQWLLSLGGGYDFTLGTGRFLAGVEVHNLGDSPAYDYFGVQRPGRSFYFKLTVESGRKGPLS